MKDSVKGTKERAARRVQAATEQASKRSAFDSDIESRKERLINPSKRSAGQAIKEFVSRGRKKNTL